MSKPPYPAEFRQQLVELVRAGGVPARLAREFNVSATTIAKWAAQDAVDQGRAPASKADALSSAERQELVQLRRENRQLKIEREILSKATAWFAGRGDKTFTPSSSS
jgi:transposase